MNLLIISASHRANSQSRKVAERARELVSASPRSFDTVEIMDLAQENLPFWAPSEPGSGSPRMSPQWTQATQRIAQADAFVFVVPEWNGMAPPQLTNLLIHCVNHELAHKPATLIGVSSGLGGSYPIAEVRGFASKDTHLCFVPEALVVRSATNFFNGPQPSNPQDKAYHTRLTYCLDVLYAYAEGLKQVRSKGVLRLEDYPYGH